MRGVVLIVDDEFGLADIVAEMLTEQGCEVAIEINGQLGLEALAQRRPDVVLLDVMMPVMDGREMLRRMKADDRYRDIPVIMMTAVPSSVTEEQAPGLVAVLRKPFEPAQLFRAVRRALGEE